MLIIAFANHKGGTGKTASTQNLAAVLASRGQRILMVDCDPQASLTGASGIDEISGHSLAEVLGGNSPGRLQLVDILQKLPDGVYLAPADIALAGVELGLVARLGRELVLKRALSALASRFDVCLVDCPPSLGLLTVNALVAADGIIIPTQPQIQDLRGLKLFLASLDQVRAELNPGLKVVGILPTFYDPRLKHHQQALEFMRDAGLPLLPVLIGRSVRVAEAAGAGQSVIAFEPGNPQSENYQRLGEAVESWLRNPI